MLQAISSLRSNTTPGLGDVDNGLSAIRQIWQTPTRRSLAFNGADVVFYLVHSMGSSRDFAAEEQGAANKVVSG